MQSGSLVISPLFTVLTATGVFVNKFSSLYSITSGIDNVELAINTRMLDLTYDLVIPNENMDDYVKVVVKFMQKDEIKKLLERENE